MADFTYGDKFSPFLHDAVLLYAIALNESLSKGKDPRSGVAVAAQMRNKVFQGMCMAASPMLQTCLKPSHSHKSSIEQTAVSVL